MKVDRTLKHLEALEDGNELRVGGLNVGDELPRNRLYLLTKFRAELAKLHEGSQFVQGYRAAILDVIAAYQSATEQKIHDMIEDPLEKYQHKFDHPWAIELKRFYDEEVIVNRDLACILMNHIDYADARKYLDLTPTDAREWETGRMAVYKNIDILVDQAQPEGHFELTHRSGLHQPIEADSPLRKLRLAFPIVIENLVRPE